MRTFSARETSWLQELDGIELAGFPQRALAFLVDLLLALIALMLVVGLSALAWYQTRKLFGLPVPPHVKIDLRFGLEEDWRHFLLNGSISILYFGIVTWLGKGRSPGKRLLRIRVVSLVHPHLSLWHSIERGLGYAAAALEFGFGFLQYFIHPYHRTVQDRIAETIVVTERSFRAMEAGRLHTPPSSHEEEAPPEGQSALPLSTDDPQQSHLQ